ncbi:hypothetical protein R6Z02_16655 [Carnobacterium maltaromaticum]|uniref:hypothetical protein n=1 Tax=Carnobacterium maltaromaticum TaxID=2751 RepID=UPI00298A51BF|nr:hypothetical protein [Carnobacterium maltaromaticum]MDW5525367.1 hypothetical protein [Carnobacterium maltaromaticum]
MRKFERQLKLILKSGQTTKVESEISDKDIRFLKAKGLIINDKKLEYTDGDQDLIPTDKGITYFSDKIDSFLNSVIFSVLLPILISIIVTILTSGLIQ